LRGGALVLSESINRCAAAVTSSTARSKACSLARDGRVVPLSFLTNCNAEARISSSVAGGSKLASVLMFRHMTLFYKAAGRLTGAGPAVGFVLQLRRLAARSTRRQTWV